jgi:hypothetical protein
VPGSSFATAKKGFGSALTGAYTDQVEIAVGAASQTQTWAFWGTMIVDQTAGGVQFYQTRLFDVTANAAFGMDAVWTVAIGNNSGVTIYGTKTFIGAAVVRLQALTFGAGNGNSDSQIMGIRIA